MATLAVSGTTWNYTYDANGMRTKRSNGSTTYEYVYSGDKLVQVIITDHTTSPETVSVIEYAYDAAGQPLTMTLGNDVYYYVLNVQGDVMGMVDGSGKLMISYVYEGYGETYHFSNTSSMTATLSNTNMLTYRGYVMDKGTGLYYLQSRYYDPNVGRFINADGYISTGQGTIGNNMFSYCLNNPVNRYDYDGTHALWWYLMETHDMGYIHRLVQLHILATRGINFKKEVVLVGAGRADIVDTTRKVVWEIKHASTIQEMRIQDAERQARGYIDGSTIMNLGPAGEFVGYFHVLVNGVMYLVYYWTPADGVILYEIKEDKHFNGPPEYAYAVESKEVKYSPASTASIAICLAPVPIAGGGGGALCFSTLPRTSNSLI